MSNTKVDGVVEEAVWWTVYWALYRTVEGAEYGVVIDAVYWAVNGAVRNASAHPNLSRYLAEAEA